MENYLEWRNVNRHTPYPLESNDQIDDSIILDAIFFLPSPIFLKNITNFGNYILFYINNDIYFRYDKNAPSDIVYNDFGKMIIGDIEKLDFYFKQYSNLKFVDTVCVETNNLTLMGLEGEVTIEADKIEIDDKKIIVSLPERTNFEYEGINKINGTEILNGAMQFTGDKCSQVTMLNGKAVLNDICLPPCYNCNERLVTGDVSQLMSLLEDRVDALEP